MYTHTYLHRNKHQHNKHNDYADYAHKKKHIWIKHVNIQIEINCYIHIHTKYTCQM